MRIFPCSDVHTECLIDGGWPWFFNGLAYDKFDLLVLAGDIVPLKNMKAFLLVFERILAKTRVVYVPGNHESWGTGVEPEQSWEEILYPARDRFPERFFPLRSGVMYEIDGVRFRGDTMWFPDTPDAWMLLRSFPEHKIIKGYPWNVMKANSVWHKASQEIQEGDVIVTHHAPSGKSCAPEYVGHRMNCFYYDYRMEKAIMERKPKLWIHGHLHSASDYQICDTRVICNPFGMVNQNTGFKKSLIVEV